ncbi:unnamed protein product [Cuscuta campestris]|uniref:Leucine-rich repeat-containing N-terminal plant-type domain-containing protein n=1 Tax=Cuscuta campestris TaxID=132261 RepID=A0A484MD78_9ASTE|nr:unnamed protein product [Cuscuta campestris]
MASTWLVLLFAAAAAAGFITVAAVNGTDDNPSSPDSSAMKMLKDSLVFPPGSPLLSTWNNQPDPCRWKGVWCDGDNRVWKIDIGNYGLDGTLPAAGLGELPYLNEFSAGRNNFTSNSFASGLFRISSNLVNVSLDFNTFLEPWKIPESLAAARNLTSFSAAGCNVNGDLSILKGMPRLKHVRLHLNQISGEIPDLSALTSLREFTASNNSLAGPVPETLGNITSLQDLSLANNYLTGAIPPAITRLTNLLRLDLSYNRLAGEIPDMSGLVSLKEFIAGYNGLSGPVPETLGNITTLQEVSLVFNNLTGTIPPAIARLTNLLRLDLSYNKLSGEIPDLSGLRSLQVFYVYSNQFTGRVPESLADIPTLQDVRLAYNSLKGNIPPEITRLTGLLRLDLSYNYQICVFTTVAADDGPACLDNAAMQNLKASLVFPTTGSSVDIGLESWNKTNACEWNGIFCDVVGQVWKVNIEGFYLGGTLTAAGLGSLPSLREFYAKGSQFTSLPSDLFANLTKLEVVSLDDNTYLSPWNIPESLTAARNLWSFSAANSNMQGTLPEFLTEKNFPALRFLDLSDHSLSGPIPSQLPATLETLRLRAQYQGHHLSGKIPDLSRFSSLKELDLNYNDLTGPIPAIIPSSLQVLRMAYNKLAGEIPDLSSLTSLQEVRLEGNTLTGAIPPITNSLTNLSTLDLSRNQIPGEIPNLSPLASLKNLYMNGNRLTGPVPELLVNLTLLEYGSLAGNSLMGTIPRNITHLTHLSQLDLSNNQLSGCVPPMAHDEHGEEVIETVGNTGITGTCLP